MTPPRQFGTLSRFITSASEMDAHLRVFAFGDDWTPSSRAIVAAPEDDEVRHIVNRDAHRYFAEVFGDGPGTPIGAKGYRYFLDVGDMQAEKKRLRKIGERRDDAVHAAIIEHARRMRGG